jgi:large subunit ribosomal protein L21
VYAIIRDRGIQYRVEEGQVLEIGLLDAEPNTQIEFGEVLLVGGDSSIIGSPTIADARVVATVLGEHKGDKIVVFKYKNKKRYRRRTGHRQRYTRVTINQIVAG